MTATEEKNTTQRKRVPCSIEQEAENIDIKNSDPCSLFKCLLQAMLVL